MIEPIHYPNINGATDRDQVAQMKHYMFQLVDQLNYTLSLLDSNTEQIKAEIEEKAKQELAKKS